MRENKIISLIARELSNETGDSKALEALNKEELIELNAQKEIYQEIWDDINDYGSDMDVNVDTAFQSFQSKFDFGSVEQPTAEVSNSNALSVLKFVGVAIIITAISFLIYNYISNTPSYSNNSNQITYEALSNNVDLVLAPNASVDLKTNTIHTITNVEGDAQFVLNTDAPLKLIIADSEYTIVKARSTSNSLIAVESTDNHYTIQLLEGDAVFSKNDITIDLDNGDVLKIEKSNADFIIEERPAYLINFPEKLLTFNNTPIALVFEKVESYFGVELIIDSEIPTDCHFSAHNIKNPSIEDIFDLLHISFNLGIKRSSLDSYRIYNITCK